MTSTRNATCICWAALAFVALPACGETVLPEAAGEASTAGATASTATGGSDTPETTDAATSAPGSDDEPVDTGSGDADDNPMDGEVPVYFDVGGIPDAPVPEACTQDVDVVFVMDVSTTMGTFLGTLANEMAAVDLALAAYDLPSAPHYGLAVFVDDAALVNAGLPYADAAALQTDFTFWSNFTAGNQQVSGAGSNSTFAENSLDALTVAATDFSWRPSETTVRIIIHTTDDTFWDGPTTGNGLPIVNSYADTVSALQAQQVRVYSFADDIGSSCNCEDVTPGWSSPYMGMATIPDSTDGGVFAIAEVLAGTASLSDAIASSVEESICDPYDPVG